MGRAINYEQARQELEAGFELAEQDFEDKTTMAAPKRVENAVNALFASKIQVFREALIGCCLAQIIDQAIEIRLPYMNQADNAYNGRTLDEKVVNPFLHEREAPSSKGPFLSTFRRNIRFVPSTVRGLRDKEAFRAMLRLIDELRERDEEGARELLRYLLYFFVDLRDVPSSRFRGLTG